MNDVVFSVAEFVAVFNQTLETAYPKVLISGEFSGANVWRDRLVFFDLKDEEATVSCMIPLSSLGVELEEGMQVRIVGRPRLSQKGRLSINVMFVVPEGEGALQRAFQLLKQKLSDEGLFDESRKRLLPEYPETIAVITAGQSAAWADFQKIVNERWPGVKLHLYDSQVQGDIAAKNITDAIKAVNEAENLADILVLIRGGGSLEDLQSFNDELVVRAVAASRVPTITGVGHESDTTLVDFVSDQRGSTPTNAAQLAVPDRQQLREYVTQVKTSLMTDVNARIENSYVRTSRYLQLLERVGGTQQIRDRVSELSQKLTSEQQQVVIIAQQKLHSARQILQALNPRSVLKRGYGIVRAGDAVSDGSGLVVGDTLSVELLKANIISEVTDVRKK